MTRFKELSGYHPAVDIFACYAEEKDSAFLDSSMTNKYGNFSIIGIHPYLKVEDRNGELFVNGVIHAGTFLDYISGYLKTHAEENPTGLPLLSGAIGYLAYDFGMSLNGLCSRHPREIDIPEGLFVFYEHFIIEDIKRKKIYLAAAECLNDRKDSLEALEKDMYARLTRHMPDVTETNTEKTAFFSRSDFEKEQYLETVDKIIHYIVEGDIYVANMTRRIFAESQLPPFEVFLRLHKANSAPFSCYLNCGDFQIICSSPERLLKLAEGVAETRPIKGTRKRGDTPAEDQELRAELLHSGKDQSELLMIVDLERNDLNKICEPGSVIVTRLFEIETYATVFQLVSTIIGKPKEGLTAIDLLAAMFPGGSVTGAPKRRAMEIIDKLEHSHRGLYTGAIGYLALSNDCDFNIVIRSAVYKNGIYNLGIGGGITCESDLASEFAETEQKAKAILEALK